MVFFLQTFLLILFFLLMELAIATVIQSLDVKEERDFDITYGHVCLEVCLLLAENVLGSHLNLDHQGHF